MSLIAQLRRDIKAVMERDPAAKGVLEVLLCYPGLHALWAYRVAHWFYRRKFFLVARLISQLARWFTGIEIHPGARIGSGFFIDHGMGVVIGETAEIGENVTLYQGVTLGGTGKEKGKRHPTVGNNVMISAGAKILGSITIGDNCKIGAGAVVVKSVPPNCTVVGVPGRVVKRNGVRVAGADLDHGDLPDPVADALVKLAAQVSRLESEVKALRARLGVEDAVLDGSSSFEAGKCG
ncbi:MAG TPA: serine O-acetyltransferase [Firmicutes bacterium]|nr:serine O-acetyltransferase [Bacillota bacterium]